MTRPRQQQRYRPSMAQLLVAVLLVVVVRTDAGGLRADGNCPILTLLPFTNQDPRTGDGSPPLGEQEQRTELEASLQRWPPKVLQHYSYTYLAAAQLAMDHFNARDPVVVPELAQLGGEDDDGCTVQFPYQVVVDSGLEDSKSIMGVLSAHHGLLSKSFLAKQRNAKRQRQLIPEGLPDYVIEQCPGLEEFSVDNLLPPWCAVLGPKTDRAVTQTAALTGALDIPQILYGTVGNMAFADDIPTTVAVSIPSPGRAKAIVSYLQRPGLERGYLAILHSPAPLLSVLVNDIAEWRGRLNGFRSVAKEVTRPKRKSSILDHFRMGAQWLRTTGIKTILLAFSDPSEIKDYAQALEEEGMLEPEYLYLLLEEGVSLDRVGDILGEQQPGSPLDKLLSGAAIISQTDHFIERSNAAEENEEEPFEKVWNMQNASFVEYLNELVPKDAATGEPIFQAKPTFFQDERPAAMATFMYDSVIAVGIGACKYQQLPGAGLPQNNLPTAGQRPQQQQQQGGQAQVQPPLQQQGGLSTPNQLPQPNLPIEGGQQDQIPADDIPNNSHNVSIPFSGQGQQQQPPNGQMPPSGQQPPPNGQGPPNGMPANGQGPPPGGQMPPNGAQSQQGQFQQGGAPPGAPPGATRRNLLGSAIKLGLLPTVDRLFAKIDAALAAMQGHDSSKEVVSRVQVTYNGSFGYPERILIVYDIPRNSSDASPRPYNEFTYFATMTNLESLQTGPKFGEETLAPTIEQSTTVAMQSAFQESLEVFIKARSLWDSHHLMYYQFEYNLFFDAVKTGANRQSTPYPWRVVVDNLVVKTVTDSKENLLFSTSRTSSTQNSSSSISDLNEENDRPVLDINATGEATANETSSSPAPTVGDSDTTAGQVSEPNSTTTTKMTGSDPEEPMGINNTDTPIDPTVNETSITELLQETENGQDEAPTASVNQTTSSPPTDAIPPNSDMPGPVSAEGLGSGSGSQGQRRPKLVNSILEASFAGASGAVSFQNDMRKSRDFGGVLMGAFNIRPSAVNLSTGLRTYTSTMTSFAMSTNSSDIDEWHPVPDEAFVFRDGGTVAPTMLRQIEDQNYLSEQVHIIGLMLFAVALFTATASGIAAFCLRNDRVVRAGQPPFLYMLCFGSALMSGAIFTLSWDESYGWSDKQLDIACSLTPWFFFVGHLLMFSALFTKLWRVDKVLQFSRQKVRVVQVMGPLVALLFAAVVVLSAWTAIDPWVWERTLIQENPAETYGECTSEHLGVWFWILASLMVLAKVTTAAMAWKTADIPQDFSDASSVFYSITTHLQAWFIGIPILIVLGNDSPDATYFGRVLLIWIFSVSGVALVVVPKIVKSIRIRRNPALMRQGDRVKVSGIAPQSRSRASGSGQEVPHSLMEESSRYHH